MIAEDVVLIKVTKTLIYNYGSSVYLAMQLRIKLNQLPLVQCL